MKIRLSDEDRERLGCPEVLDCSTMPFTVTDAEAIEDATGMESLDALKLMNPEREELPDENKVRLRMKPKGMRLRVWLGLHRAGVVVKFDELTFDFVPFLGSEIVELPGKGEPVEPPTGDSPTRSTSPTTGRRTRSKTSPAST